MASNVQERAEAYFKKDYSTWDVIAYLEFTLQNERVEHLVDLAIDSYLKDLEKVEDDGSIDQDRRQKASNLIHAYRKNVRIPTPSERSVEQSRRRKGVTGTSSRSFKADHPAMPGHNSSVLGVTTSSVLSQLKGDHRAVILALVHQVTSSVYWC
jgi:hypothetical protein